MVTFGVNKYVLHVDTFFLKNYHTKYDWFILSFMVGDLGGRYFYVPTPPPRHFHRMDVILCAPIYSTVWKLYECVV
jgi:hypothetical protein